MATSVIIAVIAIVASAITICLRDILSYRVDREAVKRTPRGKVPETMRWITKGRKWSWLWRRRRPPRLPP